MSERLLKFFKDSPYLQDLNKQHCGLKVATFDESRYEFAESEATELLAKLEQEKEQ